MKTKDEYLDMLKELHELCVYKVNMHGEDACFNCPLGIEAEHNVVGNKFVSYKCRTALGNFPDEWEVDY